MDLYIIKAQGAVNLPASTLTADKCAAPWTMMVYSISFVRPNQCPFADMLVKSLSALSGYVILSQSTLTFIAVIY